LFSKYLDYNFAAMKRNESSLIKRKELIRISVDDPKAGAVLMSAYAEKLGKAQGTTQIVKALADIFCLSETTIFRDIC
jgi:hypothetical protein